MAVKPKYSSIKGSIPVASRKFTDREEFIKVFRKSLRRKDSDGHNIIVYYGVGGIGKTSLRKELIKVLDEEYAEIIWGSLDFDLPAYREEETALYYLRQHFRKKHKIQFPSFELAYSVYWQKTHPQLKISKENLPLLEEGGIVTSLISVVGEIPLVGLIPHVTKAVIKGQKFLKSWWTKRGQRELYNLPELEAIDILNRLPMFFASDLKDYLESKGVRCVLFIDTYEALWNNMHYEGGYLMRDQWVRELVSQLPEILWIISGREKLRWDELDQDWSKSLEQHLVGNLNFNDSESFLISCGITEKNIQSLITESSKGVPYYLDLAVDTYFEIKTRYEREPYEKDFARTQSEVLDRLLKYLDRSETETLKVLSSARFWNKEIFLLLIDGFKTGFPATAMRELCRFSFVNEGVEKGTWLMHELMRKSLQNRMDNETRIATHKFLFDYYKEKLSKIEVNNITDEQQSAFKEAFYHGKISLETNEVFEWFVNLSEIFSQAYKLSLLIPLTEEFVSLIEIRIGKENLHYAEILSDLSDLYYKQGRYNDSKNELKKVIEIKQKLLGLEHQDIAKSLDELADLYTIEGKYSKAEPLFKRAISIKEKTLEQNDPSIATSYNNLAHLYLIESKFEAAEVLLKKAIEIREKSDCSQNAGIAINYSNLGVLYDDMGKYTDAESMLKKAIDIGERFLGKQNPDTATRYNNLACLYMKLGKLSESEALLKKAIEAEEKIFGTENPNVAAVYNNLAYLYTEQREYEKAESIFNKTLDIYEKTFGYEHIEIARTLNNMADLYRIQARYSDAEYLYMKSVEIAKNTCGRENILTASILSGMSKMYIEQNEIEKAEPLLEKVSKLFSKIISDDNPNIVNSLISFARIYIIKKDYVKAEKYLSRALKIRETLTPEHPDINKIQRLMKELNEDTVNKKEEDTAKKDN